MNPISLPIVDKTNAAKKLIVPFTMSDPASTTTISLGEGGKRFSINGIMIIKQ